MQTCHMPKNGLRIVVTASLSKHSMHTGKHVAYPHKSFMFNMFTLQLV